METFDGRLASEVAVDPSANIGRVFRLGHAGEGTKEDPVPERGGHISVTLSRRSGRVLNAYQGKALASAMVSKERERFAGNIQWRLERHLSLTLSLARSNDWITARESVNEGTPQGGGNDERLTVVAVVEHDI
jgi:hypothetical protein